eukprot:7801766-Alexandrium_andersonii.AAC.1
MQAGPCCPRPARTPWHRPQSPRQSNRHAGMACMCARAHTQTRTGIGKLAQIYEQTRLACSGSRPRCGLGDFEGGTSANV